MKNLLLALVAVALLVLLIYAALFRWPPWDDSASDTGGEISGSVQLFKAH